MADVVDLTGQPVTLRSAQALVQATELRGRVLGRMLSLVARRRTGIPYSEVFDDILKTFDMNEEEIGPDILNGAFFLDRANLVRISTLALDGHKPMISADTKLVPMLDLHTFMTDDF